MDGKSIVVALVTTVQGACVTPYQPMGFSGGYSDRDLGGDVHSIEVKVNGYTSQSTAAEYAYRRAAALCPNGFDPVDRSNGVDVTVTQQGGLIQKPNLTLIVRCRPLAVVAASAADHSTDSDEAKQLRAERLAAQTNPPDPSGRKIIEGDSPMFCTVDSVNGASGWCYLDESECREKRTALGSSAVDCAQRVGAACFKATEVIDQHRDQVCAPTVSDCEGKLQVVANSPDFTNAMKRCVVYRMRKPANAEP